MLPDFNLHYVATFGSEQCFVASNSGDSLVIHRYQMKSDESIFVASLDLRKPEGQEQSIQCRRTTIGGCDEDAGKPQYETWQD